MPTRTSSVRPTRTRGSRKSNAAQSPLQVLSSKTVFRGRVFDVTRDRVREPNGVTAVREVIRHSGSVVVLAVDDSTGEPCVLLERQYRYAAKACMLELPAGRIDPGETALAAGKRELREETGYSARRWKRALFFYPSPGFLEETMTVFLARGLRSGVAHPEADEFIEHELIPLPQITAMIMSGQIRDGKTVAAVLWLVQLARSNRVP